MGGWEEKVRWSGMLWAGKEAEGSRSSMEYHMLSACVGV